MTTTYGCEGETAARKHPKEMRRKKNECSTLVYNLYANFGGGSSSSPFLLVGCYWIREHVADNKLFLH